MKNFNFPNILEYNHGLRHLVIDVRVKSSVAQKDTCLNVENFDFQVQNDTDLEKEMKGKFPNKLFNITLTGQSLKNINADILRVCIPLIIYPWNFAKILNLSYSILFSLKKKKIQIFGKLMVGKKRLMIMCSGYKKSAFALRDVQHEREHSAQGDVWECRMGEERDRSPSSQRRANPSQPIKRVQARRARKTIFIETDGERKLLHLRLRHRVSHWFHFYLYSTLQLEGKRTRAGTRNISFFFFNRDRTYFGKFFL